MKKFLLPESGNYYKANLHCHSTISDGRLTPEELKQAYMEKGYSIIAYTDHDVFLPHTELNDENFLALHGFEVEMMGPLAPDDKKGKYRKRCHLCFVALEQDNLNQICWHRSKYVWGNGLKYKDQVKFDENEPDFERSMDPARINEMIRIGREKGFFVTYNHPVWSQEKYEEYMAYDGMHAMEIYNHSSAIVGHEEYCYLIYDYMLRDGKKLYCIAADDNHNGRDVNAPGSDSFGGFIWIKADKLEYRTITKALEDGHFYASTGPEIYDLWYEDGYIHARTSDAIKISANYAGLKGCAVHGTEDAPVNEAVLPVDPDDKFVRLTVFDKRGNRATTSAYFVEDLMKEEN